MVLKLTFACGPYDRMEALRTGEIRIPGVELDVVTIQSPRELFDKVSQGADFHLAEMSVSEFVSETCNAHSNHVALPVFPSKVFRHGFITINTKAGIKHPRDLAGRRIGVPLYTQTAAIWVRGLLEDEYGVDLSEVSWVQGAVEKAGSHGDPNPPPLLKPIRIENNRSDRSLSELLSAGEIDALIGARLPTGLDEDPNLARLFPDFRECEKDYYLRTRVHPIMHLVVLKKDLHEAHPWLAPRLYAAFEAAKQKAWEELSFSGAQKTMLPWLYADIAEIRTVFGHDPWPYGVEANRATLTTLLSYMHRQHFIAREPTPEEIFVPV